jgi:hypothetical protein
MNQDKLEARIALVKEHLQAENDHNLDAIMTTFGQNPKFNLNGLPLEGTDTIRGLYGGFGFGGQGSFSNLKAEVMQQHVSNESIVIELILRGKHTGNFQGIDATNQEFQIPACAIFDFDAEEKLASERVYFDGALLLKQLGVQN